MERVFASKGISLVECINSNPIYNKWHIRWDVRSEKENEGNPDLVSFLYKQIQGHKPTISEVKEIILSWMNAEIDKKILEGFEWKGMSVWLSSENQFNYKAAYDLAVQTGGANLPVVFKFGTTEEPVYYEFKTVDELSSFYMGAMNYINTTLNDGWKVKDAFDWSPYTLILDK